MKKNYLVIVTIMFSTLSFGQDCHCKENFQWIKKTFEENDAGFQYSIERKGIAAYEKLNQEIGKRIEKTNNKDSCARIILDWLHFFRKAHLGISINQTDTKKPNNNKVLKIRTADEIKATIKNVDTPGYEGIWSVGAYTIGIEKEGNSYKGYILSSTNPNWNKGEVKVEINSDNSGIFYLGDHSPINFKQTQLIGKNTLNAYFYLRREFPNFKGDPTTALYVDEMATDTAFLVSISKKTLLLRIPSFDDSQKTRLSNLLQKNDSLLKSTDNLIIDIRDNGGGSDDVYSKIIDYLYTNPIREVNAELLSTPLNNQRMADYLNYPDLDSSSRKHVQLLLDKLNQNLGKFVNLNNGRYISTIKKSQIFSKPRNVGIIINQNNGSTAEQFLLTAKESKKVKLFGVTTMGVLDISNMYFVNTPDSTFRLAYSLSKSLRIPDMAIDDRGIQPDYYIDKEISNIEWLDYVKNILEE